MLPIRRLLFRDLLTLTGVSLALGMIVAWISLKTVVHRHAEARAISSLADLQGDFQARFGRVESVGRTLADWWSSGHLTERDPVAADRIIYPYLLHNPQVANVGFWGPEGLGILFTRLGGSAGGPRAWNTFRTQRVDGTHRMQALRTNNQPQMGEAPWQPLGIDPLARPWYQIGSQLNQGQWIEPYAFPGTFAPGLSFVTPIRGEEGGLRGVLIVDVLLEELTERVWRVQPTPLSQVMVSDDRGRALILPNLPMFRGAEAQRKAFLTPIGPEFLPTAHQILKTPTADGIPIKMQDGKTTILALKEPLRGVQGVRWVLSLAIPLHELEAQARRLTGIMAVCCVLFLGFAAWRVHVLSKRFGDPLTQLARATEGLGSGAASEFQTSPIMEIRTLGEALHRAEEAIASKSNLERKVEHAQRLETVGTLAGGVAHDVNNQLLSIQGQLDLTRDSLPATHPALKRISKAEEALNRCAQMIKALLAFTHEAKPDVQALDLKEIITDSAALMERLLGGLIRIVLEPGEGVAPVVGDPTQLEQVILNLGVNARDAMPKGGTLTLRTYTHPEGWAVLEVSDTGAGIPEAIKAHIFEPFFTTKEIGKGTGLGLSMVFGIVKTHRGRIEVDSTIGKGTTFRILLPTTLSLSTGERVAILSPPAPSSSLSGLRVLVADDEPAILGLLEEALLEEQVTVKTAPDGAQAWDLFRVNDFDLVISDQRMPECTGVELLTRIRETGSKIPFVLISGHGLEHLEGVLSADPRVRILGKPFHLRDLLRVAGELVRPA